MLPPLTREHDPFYPLNKSPFIALRSMTRFRVLACRLFFRRSSCERHPLGAPGNTPFGNMAHFPSSCSPTLFRRSNCNRSSLLFVS